MSLISEKSYIVDFLQSFSLLYEIKEWDEGQETVLDRIMDKEYDNLIRQYVQDISTYQQTLSQFVTRDYNLLWNFISLQTEVRHFSDYLEGLQEVSKEQFIQLLANEFSETGNGFTLADIEQQEWLASSKWDLCLLQDNFPVKKEELLAILPELYQIYCQYAQELETIFEEKIQMVKAQLAREEAYQLIFREFVTQEIFDSKDDILLFLLSIHKVLIYLKQAQPIVGVGIYIYDYFEEQERQALLDEITMQNVLKVLADQTRYGIIKAIGKGMTSNKEIAKRFSISPSGVTYQLNFLVENRIIQKDEESKQYVVNHDLIQSALLAVLGDLDIPIK